MSVARKRLIIILVSVLLAVALMFGALAIYAADYYRADTVAIDSFRTERDPEPIYHKGYISVEPEGAKRGIILYPGGKVDPVAYVGLVQALGSYGIFAAVVDMPFNLAFFGSNAASGIMREHPEIQKWYVGGHSLGGTVAAGYAKRNDDKVDGLILLGSYANTDLTETDLKVFIAYGSEDEVIGMETYEKKMKNLPEGYTKLVIEGGNHAGFGMYGIQDGDGEATIIAAEQIRLVANLIDSFTKKK